MNKRIILVGPAGAGKDHLKKKFIERGFVPDVSYTSRTMREGETEGVDYHFIGKRQFEVLKDGGFFYEWAQHGDYYYGTGKKEWNECDIFIMETHGISEIDPEDRKSCFIIYINPPEHVRQGRLIETRGWDMENINHRKAMDDKKFDGFKDYDMVVTNPDF